MEGINNLLQVFHGAKPLVDLHIVSNVVAAILEWGFVDGVQPNGSNAQILQIVSLLQNTLQVALAIAVAVIKGDGVKLIKDRIFQLV